MRGLFDSLSTIEIKPLEFFFICLFFCRSIEQPKDLRPHKKRKFSLESIECFPKRVGIKTRDDLFDDNKRPNLFDEKRSSVPNLPEVDMESPRVTPDFRQPTNGFESARSQSDGAVATIGKSPAKNSALDDMTDVKPGIMEMIQEERRVSPFLQNTYSGSFQKA